MNALALLLGTKISYECAGFYATAEVVEVAPDGVVVFDCVHSGGADGTHGFELPAAAALALIES